MVGDHAQRDILFLILTVFHTGDPADMLHDVLHSVYQEQIVYPLHDAGETLQTHAGVNVRVRHRRVVAFAVAVELG